MKYYIFKLKFISPVRFGSDSFSYSLTGNSMTAYSDTLFSAICNEWKMIYGTISLVEFIDYAKKEEFLLSDLFPYKREELFVPKPIVFIKTKENIEDEKITNKKKLKDMNYISIEKLEDYLGFLKNGGDLPINEVDFGKTQFNTRVSISRDEKEPTPYQVSGFNFDDEAGLYFIVKISQKYLDMLKKVIESLGETGIGGKKSSGYGKFILSEEVYELGKEEGELFGIYDSDYIMAEYLTSPDKGNLSLSMLYPTEEDLKSMEKKSTYMLLTRRGFIYSDNYADKLVKRKPSVAFKQGSVFTTKMKGQILDLSIEGRHPVYRYGKGFFLGGIDNE